MFFPYRYKKHRNLLRASASKIAIIKMTPFILLWKPQEPNHIDMKNMGLDQLKSHTMYNMMVIVRAIDLATGE